jgi:hypothetical protein
MIVITPNKVGLPKGGSQGTLKYKLLMTTKKPLEHPDVLLYERRS